ncbi:antitoxin VbhA family protein [Alcaligenes faecalis]|uniref:antitoxin VbhA family protein n=1 Tax=Alcaligenes faecalis TaxID=511 RepID=UPI0015E8106A|nr:antitoxin VbhA family protein [Alcaligenes faecalis]
MSKAKRKVASDAAQASVALEGFVVPMDTLAKAEEYIHGEINIQELINHLYRQAEKK